MSKTAPAKRTQGMNWIRKEKRLAIYLRDGLACCYCGDIGMAIFIAVTAYLMIVMLMVF